MIRSFCTRVVAVVAFVGLATMGWDAEAGWRRHHRQASCCWESACCEPVCDPCYRPVCQPVCETVCESRCASACVVRTVEPSCCSWTDCGCGLVREAVIVPAATCCEGRIVASSPAATTRAVVTRDGGSSQRQASRPSSSATR